MSLTIYLRMKRHVELTKYRLLKLKDICLIIAPAKLVAQLEEIPIYRVTKKDQNLVIIDIYLVIRNLAEQFPELSIQSLGSEQAIVRVEHQKKSHRPYLAFGVWILLFIGTAITIMNFHYDVSMQEVQQKLHFILTGERSEFPLWIQVPYSLGLGVGTLLIFNHLFKKRFNEEPSPLELEISNYQKQIDDYVSLHENLINDAGHVDKSP